MFDIIALGDSTHDMFLEIPEASVQCDLDKENCKLCLNYADKIPVKELTSKVAGNACNVAVGSARLKLTSAFWTILGEDDYAKRVKRKMKEEGVSTKYIEIDKGTNSNFTTVLNYKGERTQLIHRVDRDYKLPKLEKAKYVYLTAMGENHEDIYKDLIKYCLDNNVKLAYNPGKQQIKCDKNVCIELFSYTSILFVNKEEAELILHGKEPETHKGTKKMPQHKIKKTLRELADMGPEIVVVTDGVNGSYAFSDNKAYYLPIFEGPLKERTGAGDAYGTGFMSAILQGKSTKEAMVWGTLNSWSVVQYVGPQDGLLTKYKMEKTMRENKKFRAEEI